MKAALAQTEPSVSTETQTNQTLHTSFYALLFSRTDLNSLQKQLINTVTNRTGPIHQCHWLCRAMKQLTLQGERGLHSEERRSPSPGTNSTAGAGRPEKAQVTPLILQRCCVCKSGTRRDR